MRKLLTTTLALLATASYPVFAQKTIPNGPALPDPPSICGAIAGNLVANCGFETGDFTDWTITGDSFFVTVEPSGNNGYPAHSGNFFALLGPVGTDSFLSQSLATVAGHSYTLQWFVSSDGGIPNDFDGEINGMTVFSMTNLPATRPNYTMFTETFTATSASTMLAFSFRDDPGFLALDDISVTPVPEPGSIVLLSSAIAMLGLAVRRRARNSC
jgi:PEP-CTERM motif